MLRSHWGAERGRGSPGSPSPAPSTCLKHLLDKDPLHGPAGSWDVPR